MSCDRSGCWKDAERSNLCLKHAEEEHPGELFYRGRWRSPTEAIVRIMRDPAYRGVRWTTEGTQIVGRDGGFEIRLETQLRKANG